MDWTRNSGEPRDRQMGAVDKFLNSANERTVDRVTRLTSRPNEKLEYYKRDAAVEKGAAVQRTAGISKRARTDAPLEIGIPGT